VGYRLNPPPGWPPVPEGFVPPAGWRPDPSWPAPPPGWQLWLPDDDPFSPPASPALSSATGYPSATPYPSAPSAGYTASSPYAGLPYETGAAPYPYGAGLPPQNASTSGLAIASFVLGLLGAFLLTAVLSVILGIAALAEIRRTGKRGKGLGIAGITLSGVWAVTIIGLIVLGATTGGGSNGTGSGSSGSTGQASHPAKVSVFSLPVGTCFDNPTSTALGITSVTAIACTKAHNAQVFAEFDTTGSGFPGAAALERRADSGCNARITGNLDQSKITSTMSLHFIFPQQLAWDSGQRRISCLIVDSQDVTSSVMVTPAHG
jgi:hypothetical protein